MAFLPVLFELGALAGAEEAVLATEAAALAAKAAAEASSFAASLYTGVGLDMMTATEEAGLGLGEAAGKSVLASLYAGVGDVPAESTILGSTALGEEGLFGAEALDSATSELALPPPYDWELGEPLPVYEEYRLPMYEQLEGQGGEFGDEVPNEGFLGPEGENPIGQQLGEVDNPISGEYGEEEELSDSSPNGNVDETQQANDRQFRVDEEGDIYEAYPVDEENLEAGNELPEDFLRRDPEFPVDLDSDRASIASNQAVYERTDLVMEGNADAKATATWWQKLWKGFLQHLPTLALVGGPMILQEIESQNAQNDQKQAMIQQTEEMNQNMLMNILMQGINTFLSAFLRQGG